MKKSRSLFLALSHHTMIVGQSKKDNLATGQFVTKLFNVSLCE